MALPRIVELARRIASNTDALSSYLETHQLPTPTFEVDGPADTLVPKDEAGVEAARVAIIDDTEELRRLALGPREYLMSYTVSSGPCPEHLTPGFLHLCSITNSSASRQSHDSASLTLSLFIGRLRSLTSQPPRASRRLLCAKSFAMPL
jgi:hypothetical protein